MPKVTAMPPNNPSVFKVLSIDGGGIKWVYTAAMLRELENALAKTEGHSRLADIALASAAAPTFFPMPPY